MDSKIAVFMCAFNEEQALSGILSDIHDSYDVYVIDDGSTDNTAAIARSQGAEVISHPLNLGQGMADITALKILIKRNYDILVEIDADGQHDPKEISKFVEKMKETGVDVVAGSRILGSDYENAPLSRKLLLYPLTWCSIS